MGDDDRQLPTDDRRLPTDRWERRHVIRYDIERHYPDGRRERIDGRATLESAWGALACYQSLNPQGRWVLVRYEVRETVLEQGAGGRGQATEEERTH
jgi:hypothetical protein